jgi:hypothetical protein
MIYPTTNESNYINSYDFEDDDYYNYQDYEYDRYDEEMY